MSHAQLPSESSGSNGPAPNRCLVRLRGLRHTLRAAERKVAEAILAHPEEMADIGIVELAARAGASEATVSRLARKLGFAGFPELKASFAAEGEQVSYRDIAPTDPPATVVRKVFANSIQALRDTLDALDLEQCARAVEAMLAAERLSFYGLGNAAVVAREAYQKFLRIGVTAYTAEDPDLQALILAAQLQRGDVLVALSHSGESLPVIAAAELARQHGVRVIAITNFPRSTLARTADIVLTTAVFQEHVHGEVGAKRLAQLAVLESLYVCYLLRRGHRARASLRRANAALGRNKNRGSHLTDALYS